jgi:predicted SAM-dependent methyltransferase
MARNSSQATGGRRQAAGPDRHCRLSPVPCRLNVGCGSTVSPAWTNIDNSPTMWLARRPWLWRLARRLRLVPADMADASTWAREVLVADAVRGLPFPSGSVDVIYASHFLEHLRREDARAFLREARRLLRPDGVLRLVVPDLAAIIELYRQARVERNPQAADEFFENLWVVDKGLGRYPRWFRPLKAFLRTDVHHWMYDEASLSALLAETGFVSIRRCGYLESEIDCLEEVEQPVRLENAVCLEARQPGPATGRKGTEGIDAILVE